MAGGDTRAPSFDAALRAIVECTGSTGATFMDDLVRALCRALGVRCAMVGAFADEGKTRVRSLAVAVNGEIAPPMEYALAGTPCAQVVSSGVCFYREQVTRLFPDDKLLVDMGAESYLGVPLRAADGKVLGILVVIHDAAIDETIAPDAILTIFAARAATELERLQVERELRDGGRLRRVFERLPLPASLSDPAGRREFVNPAYDRLIGLSIEDAPSVADAIRKLVVDEAELRRVAGSVAEYRERRGPGDTLTMPQVRVNAAGGRQAFLDVHMFEDGDLGVTTFVDVTDRVNSEAALRSAGDQLAEVNRELESFSYSVSHDLRAPLRHIGGFARALEKELGAALGGDARRYLDRIMAAALRMDHLIDGVLALSKVGQAPLRQTEVDLSALARDLADELDQGLRDRRVEWTIAPGIQARGDPELLRIALGNLLDNAVKYSANRPVAHVEFGSVEREGRAWAFVRDDGAGFDLRYAGKLFGAFQRLHAETEFPGNGIGLATVARVLRRHGGRIEAAGVVGDGATFSFWLPGLRTREPGS